MRAALALCLALLLLAGCGGGPEPGAEEPVYEAAVGPDGKPVPLGCELSMPSTMVDPPPELIVPPDARLIVSSVAPRADDPRVTIVEGYVELTPSKLLKTLRGAPGTEVLFTEDEQIEAEILVGDDRRRNFWKAVRTCEIASIFTAAVVGAEDGAAVAGAVQTQTKKGRRGRR